MPLELVVLNKVAPHDYGVEPPFDTPLVDSPPDDLIAKITADVKIPLLNTHDKSRATAVKLKHPVLNIRRPKLSNGKTWLALDSQSYDYFCSRGKIARGDTGQSIFSYDYLAMPIYGGTTEPAWLLLYDSLGMHAAGGNAFKSMTNLLGMAFEKEHENRTIEELKARLGRFKPQVMQAWQMPLQQNDYDCGIFVCQYIQALVEACFDGAENGVRFSMSPLAYRRGLREDVCALAEGRLIGELTAAGHEIPPGNEIRKPHEPEPGVGGDAAGDGHGDVGGDDGRGEPAHVEVMAGDNAGTRDIMRGAHVEGPGADAETGEGGKVGMRDGVGEGDMADGATNDNEKVGVRVEDAGGLLGTTDGNKGAREAVGTGQGVTASNVDVDLVSAYSTGTETTSRNTARGRAPSSGYTGVSRREGKWAARLCVDSVENKWLALGRYTETLDAAKAFAAAAHICRPSLSSSKMVELSVEERRCLEGLTSQGVERIVEAKRWAEWRKWRTVLSSLPEPSTLAPAGVHTHAPPPFSLQHPGATFGNYHPPAAAFAGHAGGTTGPGGWQPYTQSHPPPNLHFPSQQFAFNQIPIHPFSHVQAPISVHPAPSVHIAPNPAGNTAAQNTAPHPHVQSTPPAVAPGTAHPVTDPQALQIPPSEQTAQARVAGMTESQHSLSMSTSPNNPNPPSHGSALASEPAQGAADDIIDAFLGQATQ
ncbi:unnamed protein product [Closterium sp. Yama58-4]|nr:unnamed protein product [Closterium sp. Yama58-4]